MVLFCYPKTTSQSDSVKRYLSSFEGAMRINNESEPNRVAFSRSARPPPRFGPHDNGNTGFRRYLKTISEKHFAIDPDKIEEEKKLDGIFVLRTNTDLNPLEAMLCYKQL